MPTVVNEIDRLVEGRRLLDREIQLGLQPSHRSHHFIGPAVAEFDVPRLDILNDRIAMALGRSQPTTITAPGSLR